MDFPKGLRYYRKMKGITQKELGENIGANNTTVSNWEKGIAKPDMNTLVRLAEYFEITVEQLLLFKEPGRDGYPYYAAPREPGRVSDARQGYVTGGQDQPSVPLYRIGSAAGFGALLAGDRPETAGYVSVPGMPACDGAIEIRGEGMRPLLESGDIVLFRQTRDMESGIVWGRMYLVLYEIDGDQYMSVRYVHRSGMEGCVRLVAGDPTFEPLDIPKDRLKAMALIKMTIRYNVR